MRAFIVVLSVMLTGLVSGCATPTGGASLTDTTLTVQYDAERMARINRQARFRGVEVHWINPPTKREEDR